MNNEQLQDWLYELHELFGNGGGQNQQVCLVELDGKNSLLLLL